MSQNDFKLLTDYLISAKLHLVQAGQMLVTAFHHHLSKAISAEDRISICRNVLSASSEIFKDEIGKCRIEKPERISGAMMLYFHLCKHAGKAFMQAGLYEDALEVFKNVTALDKNDAVGGSYFQSALYAATNRLSEGRDYNERVCKVSAPGLFNRVLIEALLEMPDLAQHLVAASAKNPHIAGKLLQERALNEKIKDDFDFQSGSKAEAAWYVNWFGPIWWSKPRAIEQLRIHSKRLIRPVKGRSKTAEVTHRDVAGIANQIIKVDKQSRSALLRLVIEQARFLFDRQPWLRFNEQPVFGVWSDNEPPVCAHFSGSLGDLKGAFIYPSDQNYYLTQDMIDDQHSGFMPEDVIVNHSLYGWAAESLWITLESLISLPPPIRSEIDNLKMEDHRVKLPVPQMKRRGFAIWRISDDEMFLAVFGLYCLTMLATTKPMKSSDKILQIQAPPGSELAQIFSKWGSSYISSKRATEGEQGKGLGSTARKLEEALRRVKPVDKVWQVGIIAGLGHVQENPLQRPADVGAALVVDNETSSVLGIEMIKAGNSIARSVAKSLLAAFSNTGLKPRQLEVQSSHLSEEFISSLSPYIACKLSASPRAFVEAAIALKSSFNTQAAHH